MDLLTVISHELGHLLGLGDLDPGRYGHDVMTATLAPGERRLPGALDATLLHVPAAPSLDADASATAETPVPPGPRPLVLAAAGDGADFGITVSVGAAPVAVVAPQTGETFFGLFVGGPAFLVDDRRPAALAVNPTRAANFPGRYVTAALIDLAPEEDQDPLRTWLPHDKRAPESRGAPDRAEETWLRFWQQPGAGAEEALALPDDLTREVRPESLRQAVDEVFAALGQADASGIDRDAGWTPGGGWLLAGLLAAATCGEAPYRRRDEREGQFM
jgi:hypothetical protein